MVPFLVTMSIQIGATTTTIATAAASGRGATAAACGAATCVSARNFDGLAFVPTHIASHGLHRRRVVVAENGASVEQLV